MAETTGSGSSLAAAFRSALAKVSLGRARPSYSASSPLAQYRQLSGTRLGRQSLGSAGLNVSRRTQQRWAAGTQRPGPASRSAISRAYGAMQQGGIPDWVKTGQMKITGQVKTGDDVRDRGIPGSGNVPLQVELKEGNRSRSHKQGDSRTHWEAIEEALDEGADDDDLDELISDVVAEDIPPSDIWEFPGGGYTVVISG
jgi:hypothetical protein